MKILFKRKYQTLGLILIVGVIFYLLQALTMSQLSHASRRMDANQFMDRMMNGDGTGDDENNPVIISRNRIIDGDSKFQLDGKDILFENHVRDGAKKESGIILNESKKEEVTKNHYLANSYLKVANEKGKNRTANIKEKRRERGKIKEMNVQGTAVRDGSRAKLIRGVHPADMNKYKFDNLNMFRCLKVSEVRIRVDQINDDFCDCPDSSDEPGTSACPAGKFSCHQQISDLPPQFVLSSRVNDGICDCCDGSDEWNGNLVPDVMRIKAGEPRAVVEHSPCSNKCGKVLESHQQDDALRAQGKKVRDVYLKEAMRELGESERKSYGPNGVFYHLSKTCFDLEADHYTYKVCPFSQVSQSSGNSKGVVLGKTPTMSVVRGEYLLVMRDGDSHLCPSQRKRVAKIQMGCGLQDRVTRVQETEVCEYTFTMTTPAAC